MLMTCTTAPPAAATFEVDQLLADRLRLVADELGARGLPLPVIVRALLVEAADRLEADQRKNHASAGAAEPAPRK